MKGNGAPAPEGKPQAASSKKNEAAPLSHRIDERLTLEKQEYRNLRQREKDGSFDASPELNYYILSIKFLRQWMEYSEYNDKEPNKNVPRGPAPQPYNSDIVLKENGETKLRSGLVQHIEFEIVSENMMAVFKNYSGTKIERKAVLLENGRKIVEIYKLVFKYFILDYSTVKSIAQEPVRKLVTYTAEISRYVRLDEMKRKCFQLYNKTNPNCCAKDTDEIRVWKLERQTSIDDFISHVKKVYRNKPNTSVRRDLNIPSKSIEYKRDETVADFTIADDDIIIIEVKDFIKGWILSQGGASPTTGENEEDNQNNKHKTSMCEYCRQYRHIKFHCQCGTVQYCSEECKYKDLQYHSNKCKFADEVDTKQPIDMSFSAGSKRGITGLCNLGNTCFMNSCLQCLSNTNPLTEYFLSNHFQPEINLQNPIGMKGKISVNYAKTLKGLWCETSNSYSPYILKSSIAEFQPMFSGYSQHDSQEFLSFLLDGLHEDLNRVIKKPTTSTIESKGRPDNIVARESWINYLRRNQSIIVDLLMGQYKSIVTCPTCSHQSITFDPYSTISLPIPQTTTQSKTLSTISLYMLYSNFRRSTQKVTIEYSGNTAKDWKSFMAKELKLQPEQLKFFALSFNDDIMQITEDTLVDVVKNKLQQKRYDLFCIELTEEDVINMNKCKRRLEFKFINTADNNNVFTFKRPMYFNTATASGLDVYRRLFAYLYKLVILKDKGSFDVPTEKQFQKIFNRSNQQPFQIFVIEGRNQRLLKFEDELTKVVEDSAIEFEVRINNCTADNLKNLNTFETFERMKQSHDYYQNKQFTLEQCFAEFEKAEKLEEGNEWYCPKCAKHQLATKQMCIYNTPKILIIHLKRFKQKADRWFASKAKMGYMVKFPHELDMEKFVISKTLPEAYFSNVENIEPLIKSQPINADPCTKYELYAVSNHYGSMGGGHYTAYAKNGGSWYDYNDSSVYKIQPSEVINKDAYMLFYRRVDTKKGWMCV